MADVERSVLDLVGRAMGRFSMLKAGDRVAVGVSGGKDSLGLLHALVAYRRRAPFAYDVVAVTVEQGKFKAPIRGLEAQIRALDVPWELRDEPATLRLVTDGIAHGCDVCSRHRRRALYTIAGELGCTVLALGHTADDCAEALLRNILFNGRIASLPPVARSRKGGLRLVRPLAFVSEDLTSAYARALGFDTVGCVCGEKESVRREIREFLATLRARHPGVAESVSAALANVNPYTLFDPLLAKPGADISPAFEDRDGHSPEGGLHVRPEAWGVWGTP
jgi:tRNA 2-thiocytidine biosynthesis protein TtcA